VIRGVRQATVKVKLKYTAQVICKTVIKRKVSKRRYGSVSLSVIRVRLKTEIVAARCYECVLKYRKVSEFNFNIFSRSERTYVRVERTYERFENREKNNSE
jgi:hypothetical protein